MKILIRENSCHSWPLHHIPSHPKNQNYQQHCHRCPFTKKDFLNFREPCFSTEELHKNAQNNVGNEQKHQRVVRKGLLQLQVKHIVYGSLRAAARALISGNRFKCALGKNVLFLRIENIKNDKRRQQHNAYDGANPYFCLSCQSSESIVVATGVIENLF